MVLCRVVSTMQRNPHEAAYALGDSMSPEAIAGTLIEELKVLQNETDSYLQYYEQRFRLEEEHIRDLLSFLEKQRELDVRISKYVFVQS